MTISFERPAKQSGVFTGTTTASYVDGAALFEGIGAVFVIKNTAVTNGLKYKAIITLTNESGALETEMVSETTLAANTQSAIITGITAPFMKAAVKVVDAIGDSHTTYQIDMMKY